MSVKYLVPDGKHLPYTGDDGKPDHRLMGAAWAALHGGYRGNKYEGPGKDAAISKLRGIYKSEGMTPPGEEPAKGRDAILCRAKVQLAPTVTGEAMYMPAGLQEIMPFSGGVGKPIKINVDALGAQELEEQRAILAGKCRQPYFYFDHADGPASFWVESFAWKPDGIYAKGNWTAKGKESVEGKEYRYFSPVFYVDNKHGDPAQIQCRKGAKANMGALINDPAFHNILPLWAKDAGDGDADNNNNREKRENNMTDEEIAGLRAKQTELETKLEGLSARQDKREEYDATDAQLRATVAEIRVAELTAKAEAQEALLSKRAKQDAQDAVQTAIRKGQVEPRNTKLQNELVARATADPSFIRVIEQFPSNLENLTQRHGLRSGISVVSEDPEAVCSKMNRLVSDSIKAADAKDKRKVRRDMAALYAAEFSEKAPNRNRNLDISVREAIMAGDVTDGNLGTLAGTLVAQRTLELLKFSFPALTRFTTDFSDEPVTFNQTVMTRTITIPAVQTYNTTTGWADINAATTDVSVVLNSHKGVTISYNEQIMASTMRKLFDEQAPAQAYALAKNMVDALYANITDANFTNNTVVTAANFNRASVVDVQVQLNLRGVPNMPNSRTILLYSTYFGALQKDTVLMQLAQFQRPNLIEAPQPEDGPAYGIPVSGFMVYDAPNLPTNNGNVNGFAGSRSALLIVTRLPNDYTSALPGALNGTVATVTDPDIGISVMSTQYVDHTLAVAKSRLSLMYGTAAGQGSAGQLIKSNTSSGSSH